MKRYDTEADVELVRARHTLAREARRLRRERATLEAALRPRRWRWAVIAAIVVALLALGSLALPPAGAAPVAPPRVTPVPRVTPTPGALVTARNECAALAAVMIVYRGRVATVQGRVTNLGRETREIRLADLTLYDTEGARYAGAGTGTSSLDPGETAPIELSARLPERRRLARMTLDIPPCAALGLDLRRVQP